MEDKKSNFLSSFPKMKSMPHTLVLEHVSPATRLLEKRRQMFEVQENLETQKVEFNRKEEVLKRREEGLKKKDLELQESLIRFSKFLQENDSKRTRAEKKAIDEIKLRLSKERDIGDLSRSLAKLQAERDFRGGGRQPALPEVPGGRSRDLGRIPGDRGPPDAPHDAGGHEQRPAAARS